MFKLHKVKKVINTATQNDRDLHTNEGTAHRYSDEFNIKAQLLVRSEQVR